MIRRPPRSTQSRSSAASDVYKRQDLGSGLGVAHLDLVRPLLPRLQALVLGYALERDPALVVGVDAAVVRPGGAAGGGERGEGEQRCGRGPHRRGLVRRQARFIAPKTGLGAPVSSIRLL